MARGVRGKRINVAKVAAEIELKMIAEAKRPRNEIQMKTKATTENVATYWRDVAWPASALRGRWPDHPYETGGYRESIAVEQDRDAGGRFLSAFKVISRHPDANFIEFGTGDDKPGSRSPWGPFTPTPAFHPAGSTALFFRGTAP